MYKYEPYYVNCGYKRSYKKIYVYRVTTDKDIKIYEVDYRMDYKLARKQLLDMGYKTVKFELLKTTTWEE